MVLNLMYLRKRENYEQNYLSFSLKKISKNSCQIPKLFVQETYVTLYFSSLTFYYEKQTFPFQLFF